MKPFTRPALISAGFSFLCVPSGGPSALLPLCPPFPSLPLTALATNLAATEVKLVWTLILGRIAPAVFAHVPASMWGAMAGSSPHEGIFLQDTALDMKPYEMIVASLDVRGAFAHAPHRLLTEVWDAMGLPFLSFMTGYI